MLTNPACAKFIESLLDEVASDTQVDRLKMSLSDIFGSAKLDFRRADGRLVGGTAGGSIAGGVMRKLVLHLGEVNYNNSHNTNTHPGDVARQLAGRGVNSGVRYQ